MTVLAGLGSGGTTTHASEADEGLPTESGDGGYPPRVGRFTLDARLGRGGMGEVYSATDRRLGRRVALKRVRTDRTRRRHRRRLRREAWAIARIEHPAIVRIYDILEQDDDLWLVLEYVAGCTLADRMAKRAIPLDEILRWSKQMAEGLTAIHEAGLLHRDLKPTNLMIDPAQNIRILDFGLAKPYARIESSSEEASVTATGQWVGTPRAMAPEQILGGRLEPRSDLFALGTLIYSMAAGQSPFIGSDLDDTVHRVLSHVPSPLRHVLPVCPTAFDHLVRQLLAKTPEHRPVDARAVVRRLADIEHRTCRADRLGHPDPSPELEAGSRRLADRLVQPFGTASRRHTSTSSDGDRSTWASQNGVWRQDSGAMSSRTAGTPLAVSASERPQPARSRPRAPQLRRAETENRGAKGEAFMASFQSLREVNYQLREILWQAIRDEPILRAVIPTLQSITFLDPTQAARDASNRLSLWLYHIDLDGIVRNQVPPPVVRAGDSGGMSVPDVPIPLLLHYLVTPLIEPGEGDLVVLGRVLQVFHANGIFDTQDQTDGGQSLRLTFEPLAIDQISLLWQALASPMRLSVGYQVRIVRIDGEPRRGAAVRDRSQRTE